MADKNVKLLETLATALEMEEKGRAFYEGALKACTNDLGCDMFRTLMEDEAVHAAEFRAIHAGISKGNGWSAEHDLQPRHEDVARMFEQMAYKLGPSSSAVDNDDTDLKAIETGIKLEMTSIAYYQDALKRATEPLQKTFLERLVVEERGHYDALTGMRTYFTDPSAWFASHERAGLDGA